MSGKHGRPRRWTPIVAAVAVVMLLVVILAAARRLRSTSAAAESSSMPMSTSAGPPSSVSTSVSTPPRPTPPRKPAVTPVAEVNRAVRKLSAQLPAGGVSVAALDTKTGARYTYGATSGMRTGSVYKLLVLETLLLQHQDNGSQLSDYEMSLATPMIENSDNTAAYQLFLQIGGNAGLTDGIKRLGLHNTVPGQADPTLTTSSGQDGLVLAKNLVEKAPLNQYSRTLALGLMQRVQSDQRWGVGAVADPHTAFANKNGWLQVDNSNGPDEDDDSRWLVNSVGVVTVHHQQVLLSVFTQHGESYEDGVEIVEALVQAITPAVVAH